MKNAIVLITCLFLLVNFNANAQWGYIKKAAKSVGGTAKKAGSATYKGAKKAGSATYKGTKKAGSYTYKGAKKAGSATYKGAKKAGSATYKGTKKAGSYTYKGAKKAGSATYKGTKKAGSATYKGAKKAGSATYKGAKKAGSATYKGAKKAGSYTYKGGKKVWGTTKKYATKGGKLVFEGGKSFAGVIVSSGGTILVQGYGIAKEVVVNGRIPRYRRVSKREYNFANKHLFGGTLPARSKILVSNLLGVGNREFVWPTGTGHFLMNMGSSGYNNGLYDEGLFIHEITHVWQLHVTDDINWTIGGITTQVKNSATDKDAYFVDCYDNWGSMNLEQQATVAERCFLNRKAGAFGKCYEAKVIKHIRNGNGFD